MFPYFLVFTIFFPLMLALFFLLNKNSLLQRPAVFFMAAVLFVCSGWALVQGNGVYQPAESVSKILGGAFIVGNVAVLLGTAWWSRQRKEWRQGCLTVLQASLFGCLLWRFGSAAGSGYFVLDHWAGLMLLLVNGVGAVVWLVAAQSTQSHERRRSRKKQKQPIFYATFALLMAMMNGWILANQLLWMYFFWQVALWCLALLLADERTKSASANAKTFAALHSVGGIALVSGMILTFSTAGTLQIAELLVAKDATALLAAFSCLVVAGLIFSGQFPFQSGLISTATVPSTVSALLQSSVTATFGVYLVARISPVFMNTLLAKMVAVIGAFSFAAAALLGAMQQDSKRALTFMTVSSMGLAIALSAFAVLPAILAIPLLLLLHGAVKALLFLCIDSQPGVPLPQGLILMGAVSLLMPPFGMPLIQWIALESSLNHPIAMGLILAGCVFSMVGWTRFMGGRFPVDFAQLDRSRERLLAYAPQLVLAAAATGLSLFLIPFANYSVLPILKENYGRFSDIANEETSAFLIQHISGIDPLLLFAAMGGVFGLGWFGFQLVAKKMIKTDEMRQEPEACEEKTEAEGAAETLDTVPEPEPLEATETEAVTETEAEENEQENREPEIINPELPTAEPPRDETATEEVYADEAADDSVSEAPASQESMAETSRTAEVNIPDSHSLQPAPRCAVFSVFPDPKRLTLYATVLGSALVILMLEVIFR